MASLFAEMKRRNLFKVATAYLVLAWVVIQVTSEAVPAFHLPEWVNTVVFFFGLMGFPFVLLFAWAFELTPEGIKREKEVDPEASITDTTGKKLNTAIIVLLVLALGYFIYESRFAEKSLQTVEQEGQRIDASYPTDELAAHTEAKAIQASDELPASIAVLPFVNMSSDPEQEYFSDGISEEILNVLAKIPNLHVTSRSSAFAFKGQKINVSEVADKLGVANVLEGSVRKAGNRVRITAQLIEADSDKHLWSETYDRELTDIFAIQDEISNAIVNALKSKLNLAANIQPIASASVDLEAHQAYLKGRFLLEKRSQEPLEEALGEFEKALKIAPGYANAWMGKAWALLYLSEGSYGNIPREIATERARAANQQALLLDPNLAESFALKGAIYGDDEFEQAKQAYEQAIELNPNFVNTYIWYADDIPQDSVTNLKKRFELRKKAYRLDPLSPLSAVNYAYSLIDYERFDEALAIAEDLLKVSPDSAFGYNILTTVYANKFEYGKSLFMQQKAYQASPNLGAGFRMGFDLSRLGLLNEAVALVAETANSPLQYSFTGNYELAATKARQMYPRSENDIFGHMYRGAAESLAGNCTEALPFLAKTRCNTCDFILHCSKETGDIEAYEAILKQRKEQIELFRLAGYQEGGWLFSQINLLVYEGQLEQAISLLEPQLDKGYIFRTGTLNMRWHSMLRQHPKWPLLFEKSEANRIKQKNIYLDLMAKDGRPKVSAPL